MTNIILLNLLGMCVSFLLICNAEREDRGDIEGLVTDIWLVIVATIIWPAGIIAWCCFNFDKLFKERKLF